MMKSIDPSGFLGARKVSTESLPDIDLAPLYGGPPAGRREMLARMRAACTESGFFCVHGTRLTDRIITETLRQSVRFHELTDDSKRAYHNSRSQIGRGWWPLHEEPAYQPGTVAFVESFDIGPEQEHLDLARHVGPNLWPVVPGFREAVWGCYEMLEELGDRLLVAFAEMLELESDTFSRWRGPFSRSQMRLLRYPENDAPLDEINVGISAHTDFECFTLMYQTAPGLHVKNVHDEWVQLPAGPSRWMVILGDMLERWSNGYLKATAHRVVNTPWERLSIVMFCAVDGDTVVQPLPQFVSAGNPSRYERVTQGQHLDQQVDAALQRNRDS